MLSAVRLPYTCCLCAVLFFSLTPLAQNTIHVPTDQPTIQGAINVANNGDTVQVAPGTYYENINFNGKAITVTSTAGTAQTIIDGGNANPVVRFSSGEGSGSVLNGFTIQNGVGNFSSQYSGGGVYINVASPTLMNNVIQGNCSSGITAWHSSALIKKNTIRGNGSIAGNCLGGGIALIYAGSAQVLGNIITNNLASGGAGIYIFGAGSPTVRDNLITGNTATGLDPTQGAGIALYDTGGLIVQNVIYGNTIVNNNLNRAQGSGIYLSIAAGGSPLLVNNTVIGDPSVTLGSAIYAYGTDAQIAFYNNLLIGPSGQNAVYCDPQNQQMPTFVNNNAFSPGGSGLAGACSSQSNQNGNIGVDPLFIDPGADFHLQPSSPAIDAGTNSVAGLTPVDFDGNPRILDGNNDCVSTVDMGSFELQQTAQISLSTNALSFGNQVIGASSNPQTVTATNSGKTCFQFSNIQITPDFSEGTNCGARGVPGGSSCSYYVTFSPTATGQRSGALTVGGSDGVSTSNLNVNLSGYGLTAQPSLSLSPASLSFGAQLVGTTSAVQTITLTSAGNTGLVFSGISVSGPFVQGNNCPPSLAAAGTCTISISFRPTAGGTQLGSLSVTDNASGSPHTANLSGTGIDFSISANPPSAAVKHGQSVKFTIAVSPLGGAFGSAIALSCSGLPTGGSCSFSPSSVTPGDHNATSLMTFSTTGKTARGNYNVLVIGKSGTDVHSTPVLISVN